MKDKLVRLCSIALALLLSAGWFAFAQRTDLIARDRIEAQIGSGGESAPASVSYHFVSTPDLPDPAGAAACVPCHGESPHKKASFSRAFLNLHGPRLDCMACHLEEKKRRPTRLGWFESTPAGLKGSSGDNMKAFLAPYVDGPGGREIFHGRSNGPAAEVSDEGKHRMDFDEPRCSSCHSGKGLAKLEGYEGEALARLGKLDRITRFAEGQVFYYPRF